MPDPTDPQALNRYSYVMNNPVNATDPSGHAGVYLQFPPVSVTVPQVIPAIGGNVGQISIAVPSGGTFAIGGSYGIGGFYLNASSNLGISTAVAPIGTYIIHHAGNGFIAGSFYGSGSPPPAPSVKPPAAASAARPISASIKDFALGLIPGYDLGQALGDPDAGVGDYFLGVLGLTPAGKGAKVGFEGIFNAVRHLLKPGTSPGIFTFHGGQEGLESLFLEVGQHGRLIDHPTFKGLFVDLGQGANVTMRDSAKHGPTMGVKIPGIKYEKIHLPK